MTLAGDAMLYHISPKKNPLAAVSKITSASDLFIVNLEVPLTSAATPTARKTPQQVKAKQQFILKADPAHIKHLVAAGVDGVSLGNNHTMDYGVNGLLEEIGLLRRNGIAHCGAGQNLEQAAAPSFVQSGKSPKVGMVSFLAFIGEKHRWMNTPATPKSAGVAVPPFGSSVNKDAKAKMKKIVDDARSRSEFVVVALHGGIERRTVPTAYQVSLARGFIDAGADLVVGHHPHVLQGAELYRGKPILYSTGNLVNSLPGTTALFHLRFAGGRLEKAVLTPCAIAKGAVAPMKSKRAKLALKDFDKLSQLIQRKYPDKRARPLLSSYRR
jgi:poly-gamma-glutamate synthesis protein (capsule biosynthesis protein)